MTGRALSLPSMKSLATAYPQEMYPEAVKKIIGGHVNASWIFDTCAIRMSRALNYSNFPIPGPGHSPMKVVSGADKKWYALNHAQLREWIHQVAGPPQIHQKRPNVDRGALNTLMGIIALDIHYAPRPGEHLAPTGHIDLWHGQFIGEISQAGTEDEVFGVATDVQLWTLPAG